MLHAYAVNERYVLRCIALMLFLVRRMVRKSNSDSEAQRSLNLGAATVTLTAARAIAGDAANAARLTSNGQRAGTRTSLFDIMQQGSIAWPFGVAAVTAVAASHRSRPAERTSHIPSPERGR